MRRTKADNDWMTTIADDDAKVDYMKARVAAEAATEQARIKEAAQTERARVGDGAYQGSRTAFRVCALVALVIVSIVAGCTGLEVARIQQSVTEKQVALEVMRVQAEHPGSFTCPAPPVCPPTNR